MKALLLVAVLGIIGIISVGCDPQNRTYVQTTEGAIDCAYHKTEVGFVRQILAAGTNNLQLFVKVGRSDSPIETKDELSYVAVNVNVDLKVGDRVEVIHTSVYDPNSQRYEYSRTIKGLAAK